MFQFKTVFEVTIEHIFSKLKAKMSCAKDGLSTALQVKSSQIYLRHKDKHGDCKINITNKTISIQY